MKNLRIAKLLLWTEIVFAGMVILFWWDDAGNTTLVSGVHRLIYLGTTFDYPPIGYQTIYTIPILLGISVNQFSLWLHLSLVLLGVYLFVREFNITPTWWTGMLVVPYISMFSWPYTYGIPCFLLLVAVISLRHNKLWLAALLLGSCYLIRTEFLAWGLLALLGTRYSWRLAVVLTGFVAVTILLTGSIVSSYSSAVFYDALGQSENNPWGIVYLDSTANSIVHQNGFNSPWYGDGAKLMQKLSYQAITSHPFAYIEKCARNLFRAALTGPHNGNWAKNPDWSGLRYLLVAVYGLTALWLYWWLWKLRRTEVGKLLFVIVMIAFFTQALTNQSKRHSTVFWLPMVGLVLEARRKDREPTDEAIKYRQTREVWEAD